MAIKDLQARQGQVDLIAEIIEKGDIREFEKFGKKGRVCNAKIKDSTGSITLTLWNEQIDNVKVGDKVHVINGWVSEWQGEKQLSTGKFGQLEIIEGGEETKDETEKTKDLGEKEMKSDEEEERSSDDEESDDDAYSEDDEIIKDEEEIK